jgi:hypothetical protein
MRKPTAAASKRYENRAEHARFFCPSRKRRKEEPVQKLQIDDPELENVIEEKAKN